jgi:hypothetical protein
MELPNLRGYIWGVVVNSTSEEPCSITLFIKLYQRGPNNHNIGPVASVKFINIKNYEDVKSFFSSLAASRHAHESIAYLGFDESKQSRSDNLFIKVLFDRTSDTITIQCQSVDESDVAYPVTDFDQREFEKQIHADRQARKRARRK